jgi:hypothetical protein
MSIGSSYNIGPQPTLPTKQPNIRLDINMIGRNIEKRPQLLDELLEICKQELTTEEVDKMGSAKRWRAIEIAYAKIAILIELEGRMREEKGEDGEIGEEEAHMIAAANANR